MEMQGRIGNSTLPNRVHKEGDLLEVKRVRLGQIHSPPKASFMKTRSLDWSKFRTTWRESNGRSQSIEKNRTKFRTEDRKTLVSS